MSDLLKNALEAHGGIARWNSFSTVRAQIVTGGGLWALKGLNQDPAPPMETVSLREEFASVSLFGQANWRTNFRPDRVAIEMALPGFEVREIDPITEGHEVWRGPPRVIRNESDLRVIGEGDACALRLPCPANDTTGTQAAVKTNLSIGRRWNSDCRAIRRSTVGRS